MKRLLAAHTALVYLFLYLPIAVLVVFSFNAGRQTAVWEGFTLDWYRRLAEDDRLLGSVRNSLLVAGTTTLIATVLGTMAALALARQAFRGRRSTEVTLFLPIILPEVILGAALLTPVVPAALAGAGLTAFSAGLLGLYLKVPGMRQQGTLKPTQEGQAIAKDSWLLGIGLALLLDR